MHSIVERLSHSILDFNEVISRPYRSIDTLAEMERRGSISPAMRAAGETFRENFAAAHLDPLRAANIYRSAVGTNPLDHGSIKMECARERVWNAIAAVGGITSPAGSCVWHVVGWEQTIKDWALGQGWAGRQIRQETASGILIAGLGVLEIHFLGR